jgi:hypothetical protein|tara:strand:- start:2605 stop:2829 length:225 start_codon:yes stop_codon:yes gene_type:complete
MVVEELIEMLQGCNPEAEIRFASQPSWPFEYSINDAVEVEIENNRTGQSQDVVFLEEGSQLGYLPSEAKNQLMW